MTRFTKLISHFLISSDRYLVEWWSMWMKWETGSHGSSTSVSLDIPSMWVSNYGHCVSSFCCLCAMVQCYLRLKLNSKREYRWLDPIIIHAMVLLQNSNGWPWFTIKRTLHNSEFSKNWLQNSSIKNQKVINIIYYSFIMNTKFSMVGAWMCMLFVFLYVPEFLHLSNLCYQALTINELKDMYFCVSNSTIFPGSSWWVAVLIDIDDSWNAMVLISSSEVQLGNIYMEIQGIAYEETWDFWQNIVALGGLLVGFQLLALLSFSQVKKYKWRVDSSILFFNEMEETVSLLGPIMVATSQLNDNSIAVHVITIAIDQMSALLPHRCLSL